MRRTCLIPALRGVRGVFSKAATSCKLLVFTFFFGNRVAKHTPRTPLKEGIFYTRMLILLGFAFFKTAALFAQANASDTSSDAFLSVYSLEEGLPVLMNGNAAGATPLRRLALPAGQYEIAVQAAQATSWWDEDWSGHVTLHAGDSLSLIAIMMKGYRINSVPYGAQVWLQDNLLGTTPYVFRLPENQTAQLELKHPSFQSAHVEVGRRVEGAWRERNYEIVLERDFNYAALQQHESEQRRSRAAKYRKLTYLSAAISLASGVSSVLLKREADEAFEDYLVTGDPVLRENYFARAEKYDRYYSAAFATFEVSFAVSFYGFLKSLNK